MYKFTLNIHSIVQPISDKTSSTYGHSTAGEVASRLGPPSSMILRPR